MRASNAPKPKWSPAFTGWVKKDCADARRLASSTAAGGPNRPQVAGAPVDQRRLCSAEQMGSGRAPARATG